MGRKLRTTWLNRLASVILAMATTLVTGCAPTATTAHRIDPDTGIETWQTRANGVSLRLTQILPDQARAFYYGRGFDTGAVEQIATGACVFQSVFRNESVQDGIRFDLGEWRAQHAGQEIPLRLNADWQREWEARQVPAGPRTAFRFALLPTAHEYQVGDWNMGMTLYPLPLGSVFDLRFTWWSHGQRYESVLRDVHCATDSLKERP